MTYKPGFLAVLPLLGRRKYWKQNFDFLIFLDFSDHFMWENRQKSFFWAENGPKNPNNSKNQNSDSNTSFGLIRARHSQETRFVGQKIYSNELKKRFKKFDFSRFFYRNSRNLARRPQLRDIRSRKWTKIFQFCKKILILHFQEIKICENKENLKWWARHPPLLPPPPRKNRGST